MFGTWLDERIRDRSLTEQAIAELVGVSQQAVSRWRSGESRPGGVRIGRLAAALGVDVEELIRELESDQEIRLLRRDPPVDLAAELAQLRERVDQLEQIVSSSRKSEHETG